ncbi:MAG: N-acetylmuramoyl-L-alanine amidase [Candidatus Acidiferrales bacterium]
MPFPKVAAQAQQSPAQQSPAQPAGQSPASPQPASTLRTIVIDPGHGGEDTGARGPSGVAEKDIVIEFAQTVASSLRAQGFEVVMTRLGDTDPSLDDRATVVNAQTNAIFISLHVGSSGLVGTVRTYTYRFPATPQFAPPSAQGANLAAPQPAAPPPGFLLWSEAQKPFLAQSVKLGDLIQVELAQKFKGSPEISSSVPVAVLRSVAAPAVAVEISSVAANQQQLESMSTDLAYSIARAVAAYKTVYPPGGK